MFKTIHPSDLFFEIYAIYSKTDEYVKCTVLYFYKSNNQICRWLNPSGRPKKFKINRTVYDSYVNYTPVRVV